MAEQRYRAVLAVISEGWTSREVAAAVDLGLHHPPPDRFPTQAELLGHRPGSGGVGGIVLMMLLHHPDGPSSQLRVDLLRHVVILANSERNGMEPVTLQNELWQMDSVGGFLLADGLMGTAAFIAGFLALMTGADRSRVAGSGWRHRPRSA